MKFILLTTIAASALFFSCSNSDASNTEANNAHSHTETTANANDPGSVTTIQWLDSTHQELGKVKEGGVVEVSWKFKNTGDKPLVISNVNASCGCTVADKPEQPIAPGKEGVISAKFDSKGRDGVQRKDVYVTANTSENTNHQLSFSVDVTKQ